jgi:hypothetical protein
LSQDAALKLATLGIVLDCAHFIVAGVLGLITSVYVLPMVMMPKHLKKYQRWLKVYIIPFFLTMIAGGATWIFIYAQLYYAYSSLPEVAVNLSHLIGG